jgi:preprotein translocase subunit SecY
VYTYTVCTVVHITIATRFHHPLPPRIVHITIATRLHHSPYAPLTLRPASVAPPIAQSVVFGVASTADGLFGAILQQFDFFVNGQELELSAQAYKAQPITYLVLYFVSSLALFLLLSQVCCLAPCAQSKLSGRELEACPIVRNGTGLGDPIFYALRLI